LAFDDLAKSPDNQRFLMFIKIKIMKINCFVIVLIMSIIIALLENCKKTEFPAITTIDITEVSQTSVVTGGDMIIEGSSPIISKGVCWSTTIEPTINDKKFNYGRGTDNFKCKIVNLNPGTRYFVRAYATNNDGTGYGLEKSFSTGPATIPDILTISVSSITQTTAFSGGMIISNGASPITACGVCWSTSRNPTIDDNKTTEPIDRITFISYLTGLSSNTTYNLRAYSTNSIGTAYGVEISFKTSPDN
jgi:hypothetical protein